MSAVVVAVVILLVALMIVVGVIGTVLAVQQSQREQAAQATAAQVFLPANSNPQNSLDGKIVHLRFLPTFSIAKPVFGCTHLGGHAICLNDTSSESDNIKLWKIVTVRQDDNIVSFQNVQLGTWLHAIPDSPIVSADVQDNSDFLTHWKLFQVTRQGADNIFLIQNAQTRLFLTMARDTQNVPVLTSAPYNLDEDAFSWIVEIVDQS